MALPTACAPRVELPERFRGDSKSSKDYSVPSACPFTHTTCAASMKVLGRLAGDGCWVLIVMIRLLVEE